MSNVPKNEPGGVKPPKVPKATADNSPENPGDPLLSPQETRDELEQAFQSIRSDLEKGATAVTVLPDEHPGALVREQQISDLPTPRLPSMSDMTRPSPLPPVSRSSQPPEPKLPPSQKPTQYPKVDIQPLIDATAPEETGRVHAAVQMTREVLRRGSSPSLRASPMPREFKLDEVGIGLPVVQSLPSTLGDAVHDYLVEARQKKEAQKDAEDRFIKQILLMYAEKDIDLKPLWHKAQCFVYANKILTPKQAADLFKAFLQDFTHNLKRFVSGKRNVPQQKVSLYAYVQAQKLLGPDSDLDQEVLCDEVTIATVKQIEQLLTGFEPVQATQEHYSAFIYETDFNKPF